MKRLSRIYYVLLPLTSALLMVSTISQAATFSFNTDPFAGSTALTTPGRQVVGGEDFISFSTTTDVFEFSAAAFGVSSLQFANDVIANVPTTGVNVVVLRTFDNDADSGTPFGAGNAANLLADRITSDGPGFFVYFNSGLNLARLVYSTNLSDNTADLKVLARMENFIGATGQASMANFTASNFRLASSVPESASNLIFLIAAGALAVAQRIFGRRPD
jgi:hypothetical protein